MQVIYIFCILCSSSVVVIFVNILGLWNESSGFVFSYREVCFDIRILWITSMLPERIMLSDQGFMVLKLPSYRGVGEEEAAWRLERDGGE